VADDDDHADIEALYQEVGPGLIRYLRRVLQHNNALAEDIAQDAFLNLVRKWPEARKHPNSKAYLYKVARHLAIDTLKERSRIFLKEEPPDQQAAGEDDPADSYTVREAVWKLPPRQREAVWLFYFLDFKQNEIATIMQIQAGTVAALLSQARSRLAELLVWPGEEGSVPLPSPPARTRPSLPLTDLDRRGPRETIAFRPWAMGHPVRRPVCRRAGEGRRVRGSGTCWASAQIRSSPASCSACW
jgi:RNA polymerase sigma factor (sigma-70 family)